MSEKELLVDRERWYRLLENQNGLTIAVMCGGIGMYEVKVRLTSEDAESFKTLGKNYLDRLAKDIAYDSEKYRDRWVLG